MYRSMSLGSRSRFIITRCTISRSVATWCGSSPWRPRRSLSVPLEGDGSVERLVAEDVEAAFLHGVLIAWTMATTTGPHTVSRMLLIAYGTV